MPAETSNLMTASAIAKQLGVSEAKVKKAIGARGIQPAAKKGCCVYYSEEGLKQIESALKA